MSRWRIAVVGLLIALPFAFLALAGTWYLWRELRGGFLIWCGVTAMMGLGYALGWYWQRRRQLLHPVVSESPVYWTERDRQAWQRVEARAKAAAEIDPAKFTDLQYYVAVGEEMARELAAFYHPRAQDPVGSLTIPEILAVIELASHDMAELVDRYLPGGHMLTINDWLLARKATKWYQAASNVYWLVSAVFSPLNTGIRYAASSVGLSRPFQMLQENLLLWFFTAYIHRLGTYLIDLNSGRLRVGAARYRRLRDAATGASPTTNGDVAAADRDDAIDPAVEQVQRVTITLMGQVKAGKSSLVNALLGEQRARTDVLPATSGVERYELKSPNVPTRLVLLDTVGYGHTGPRADQLAATREAARDSDLLLLVLQARNPARQADLELLKDLQQWFAARPELRKPPIIAVVTHIDLLSPAMEWAPPYDWRRPSRPKEQHIHEALLTVQEQLGAYLADAVPACVAAEKVYGIDEWLWPALAQRLDEVRGVALLRCLKAETDAGKVRKVFHQMLAAGKEAAKVTWQSLVR
jgi:predicted GTPase